MEPVNYYLLDLPVVPSSVSPQQAPPANDVAYRTYRGTNCTVESPLTFDEVMTVLEGCPDSFAQSLLRDMRKYGRRITANKLAWAHNMALRAIDRELAIEDGEIDEVVHDTSNESLASKASFSFLLDYMTIFMSTHNRLKAYFTHDENVVCLSLNGSKSRYPGHISVTDGRPYGSNIYYGRIDRQGQLYLKSSCDPKVHTLLVNLCIASGWINARTTY